MNKKLVIATDCFLPRWDGIARFLLETISCISQDWDIVVLAPDFKGREVEFENVSIVRIPISYFKVGDYPIPKNDKKTIDEVIEDADLVWVHTAATIGKQAIKSAKKFNHPVIYQIHSIDYELFAKSINVHKALQDTVYFFSKKYLINIYEQCDLLISPSRNVDEMIEWNDIKVPVSKVKMGVNTENFVPPKDKEEAKLNLSISPDAQVIGFCGRIAEEKNIETLLEAFRRIKNEYPKLMLLIVGSGLKKYKNKLEHNPRIIYVGEKDEVIPYLQAMDIFVLPSLVETTSLATLEAMACEVTPVCTPVGYVKEYIKEKRNGLLFPLQNATVLSLKLKWLLKEEYVRKQLGKQARKTVQKDFCLNNTISDIRRILKSVVE